MKIWQKFNKIFCSFLTVLLKNLFYEIALLLKKPPEYLLYMSDRCVFRAGFVCIIV